MGAIAKYVLSASERKRYQIDYSDWLDVGEGVSSVAFTVDKATTPPLVIDDDMLLPSGDGVQYYISGGVDNVTYEVTVVMNTNQGQVREDAVIVTIREP